MYCDNGVSWKQLICEDIATTYYSELLCLNCEHKDKFISVTCNLRLSDQGRGGIVFNISQLELFTIAVKNYNGVKIQGYLEVSPDRYSYKMEPGSKIEIEPSALGVFVGKIFLKYSAIEIEGPANGIVSIFFQGQY